MKSLQPVNLAILTIWSLFNPIAVPAPHLLSPFLAHQPSPHWKSQIARSDMHHPVSGINSLIHPSASRVMSRLTSSFIVSSSPSSSPLSPSTTPSLFHSSLKTCLFNKSFPPQYFFYPGLPSSSRSLDQSGLIMLLDLFLARFFFNVLFVPCGVLSCMVHVSVLLHVKYTTSYRIVSHVTIIIWTTDSWCCWLPLSLTARTYYGETAKPIKLPLRRPTGISFGECRTFRWTYSPDNFPPHLGHSLLLLKWKFENPYCWP